MAQKHSRHLCTENKKNWSNVWRLIGIELLGLCVGVWVGQLITWLFPFEHREIGLATPAAYKQWLLMTQAAFSMSTFIGAPLFYLCFLEKKKITLLFQWKPPYLYAGLLTIGLTFAFMHVNTLFMQWNMAMKLPGFLAPFEAWAQTKEAECQKTINLLTTFHTPIDLLWGVLLLGMLPAVGEELLFRGLCQHLLHKITQNRHLAIYGSAFIFSLIHFQFYGFLPRLLLGALFGYIYAWTQDLLFPIMAHFFNNTFTLVLLFLSQKGYLTQDTASIALPLPTLVVFTVISLAFLISLRKYSQQHHQQPMP